MLLLGCFRNVVLLILLVAVGAGIYLYRDRIAQEWHRFRGDERPVAVATPEEVAAMAERKVATLADGPPPARVALSEAELQALLKTRFKGMVPRYLDSARVELDGDRIHLKGRIPTDRLPRVPGVGEIMGLLPDTTDITVTGQVIPLEGERAALAVDQVTAAKIPLPRRLVTEMLQRVKRPGTADLPPDALPLPLPRGVAGAYVRGDSLILLARGSAPAPTRAR